jgi:hypothetical protein
MLEVRIVGSWSANVGGLALLGIAGLWIATAGRLGQ